MNVKDFQKWHYKTFGRKPVFNKVETEKVSSKFIIIRYTIVGGDGISKSYKAQGDGLTDERAKENAINHFLSQVDKSLL